MEEDDDGRRALASGATTQAAIRLGTKDSGTEQG